MSGDSAHGGPGPDPSPTDVLWTGGKTYLCCKSRSDLQTLSFFVFGGSCDGLTTPHFCGKNDTIE